MAKDIIKSLKRQNIILTIVVIIQALYFYQVGKGKRDKVERV